jgi:serpin B
LLVPGARGTSASELESVLGYTGLTPDQAAYALGAQDSATEQRAVADSDTLTEADGVWAQKGLTLQGSYLQTLSGAFSTGVWQPDFKADPAAATKEINNQVSQETKGMVPQLFGPGAIDGSTRLVLTDATYFKAPWAQSFEPSETSPANFTTSAGTTASVPMMNQTAQFGYASGSGWQAVQLPYGGGQLAMDVLLPTSSAKGALASYRAGLTQSGLTALADLFKPESVELSLPRFTTTTTEGSLSEALQQLGLRSVFTGSADLSGIFTTDQGLYVQTIVQQAKIEVGEQGTTAAAGSGIAVGSAGIALPQPLEVFDADHPFVYMIRDVISNQVLFIGQVADPS